MFALMCNFTFLATAQTKASTNPALEIIPSARQLPECIHSLGADSMKTRVYMAYFQENWKKKDHNNAYACWSYVFRNAPCSYKSIYQRAPDLFHFLMAEARSEERRLALLDTLFMTFPMRIKYFGEEALVKGIWANKLALYRPAESKQIMELYAFYVYHHRSRMESKYVKDYLRNAILARKSSLIDDVQLCSIYKRLKDSAELYKLQTISDTTINKYWVSTINAMEQMMAAEIICSNVKSQPSAMLRRENGIYTTKKCA